MNGKLRISIVLIGILSLRLAIAQEPGPRAGEYILAEFEAGLKQRGAWEKFAAHVEFSKKLFDDSRGGKTFSDKTGNCRLPWVEQLVTQPAQAVDEAEQFTRAVMTAVRQQDGLARVLDMAAVKLDAGGDKLPAFPPDGNDAIEQLAAIVAAARRALDQAVAPLSPDEQAELRQDLYLQTTGELNLGHRFVDKERGRRVVDLLEKLDRRKLLESAAALAAASDIKLLNALAKIEAQQPPEFPGVKGKLLMRAETPLGTILVGGAEANEYPLDALADVCAVVDVGGNDVYIEGTTTVRRPVLIVIDLAGDDVYRGEKPGIQGGAILGASLLVDLAGNDQYTAGDVAQGSALGGVGILIDADGADHYRGDRRVQGQAVAGCGVLLDRGGDDDYRGALLAQGVGGPIGLGLLADLAGGDHYFAGGKYPGGYDDTPGFGGWSQGVGIGPRGVANGGIGVLLDGGGDDIYEADYFSHGGGYWFAAGFARDFGGNDQRIGATRENFDGSERTERRFVRWGTGYGCHYAVGFVFDDEGNDVYQADFAAVSFAWDIAVAAICDFAGNDVYKGSGNGGVAQARNAALAILYDKAGDDQYQGGLGRSEEETPYHPEASGNYTLLLDDAGDDQYSDEINNHSEQTRGWAGAALIDR